MGISIYYSARRPRPLSPDEFAGIDQAKSRFSLEVLVCECEVSETDFDGEEFCVYSASVEPGVVFEGATKLPMFSEEVIWVALQYWCRLLTEIRSILPDAEWHVHVDDHDIPWNDQLRAFDPS